MSYFLLSKKIIQSQFFYLKGSIFQYSFLFIQASVALYCGIYMNSLRHLISPESLCIYYVIGLGIINPFQRNQIVRQIETEVESGDISIHFTKPYNFFFHQVIKDLSTRILSIIVVAIITAAIVIVTFGSISFTIDQLLRTIVLIPTLTYMYAIIFIFAQFALVMENASWLWAVFGVVSFYVGGGIIPISFLPSFAQYLPQAFFFNSPLTFIIEGVYPHVWLFSIYFCTVILINYIIFMYIRKRIQINGG